MVDSTRRPKVGLLGLTLEFYERLAPSLRPDRERFVRERLIPNLGETAEVRFDGAVFTREGVERAVAEFERDGADAILVVLLSYSPSLIAAPALQRTRLPIVVWNTQELLSVDRSYGDAELIANHGVHGTHDLCNVLVRAGVPFHYVTGHVDDRQAIAVLADHFQAACAVGRLRRARLGLLGYPFPGMGDFGLDTTQMATSLGCAWEALSLSEYNRRTGKADPGAVAQLVAEYRCGYEIGPNIAEEDLAAAARAEIAMRGIVRDYRLDAYSYQFLSFGEDDRTETLPFVAASRLLADGIGFGGEGDLIAAAHSALVGWLHPPASFSEMFTIDFGGNAVLLSHMGEANVAMARKDRKVRLVRRPGP
ncbi:MAG: L-arabinose isomerase family protein, partial [Phycisphaerae bacterium]